MKTKLLLRSTNIIPPLCAIIFLVLGNSFFNTFVTSYLTLKEIPPYLIGFLHSTFFTGVVLGSWFASTLTSRLGHGKSLTLLGLCLCSVTMFLSLTPPPYAWIPVRFISGLGIGGFYVTVESWLLLETPRESKGHTLSLYNISLYVSHSVSQLIFSMLTVESMSPFLVSAVFLCLAALPTRFSKKQSPHIQTRQKILIRKFLTVAKVGIYGCFLSGLLLGAIYSFIPSFAITHHLSPALLTFTTIAGGAVSQWTVGQLSDKMNRKQLLFLIVSLSLIPITVMVLGYRSIPAIYLCCFILGSFCFPVYPVSMAIFSDNVPSELMVQASSFILFIYSIGTILGPLIVGTLLSYNPEWLFHYFFFCMLSGIIVMVANLFSKEGRLNGDLGTSEQIRFEQK